MTSSPLRCHLLIGPAASGKSTLAKVLAECTNATVLSPDAIRAELYGDEADQGSWGEIEPVLHQRLKDAVTAGRPVIVDATHTQRPWRLAILQGLDLQEPVQQGHELPEPVQWIGWWLTTPLEQCLAWNRQRDRQVDEDVIRRHFAQLLDRGKISASRMELKEGHDPVFPIQSEGQLNSFINRQRSHFREEGFALVVAINPASITGSLHDHLEDIVKRLKANIQRASCRKSKKVFVLHRYSRLLDLERLIFLIRLLLEFPGVDLADATVEQELRASFRFEPKAPLPDEEASFATRAAYALHHRHGACYGDEDAVAEDLQWLLDQEFVTLADLPVSGPVDPGEADERTEQLHKNGAGFPAAADHSVFQRQFGLLRHLIHNPFDAPSEHSPKPYTSLQDLNRLTALIRLLLLVFKEDEVKDQDKDQDNSQVKPSKKRTVVDRDDNAKAWELEILRRASKTHQRHKARPSFATRVAFVLRHRHPNQPGYGDRHAIAEDLHWLKEQREQREQKKKQKEKENREAPNQRIRHSTRSGQQSPPEAGMNNSGSDHQAEEKQTNADNQKDRFGGLLEKFFNTVQDEVLNHEPPPSPWKQRLVRTDPKTSAEHSGNKKTRQRSSPPSLRVHLIQRLAELGVSGYTSTREKYSNQRLEKHEQQVRTLDKDIELFIKRYGFTTIIQHKHGNL